MCKLASSENSEYRTFINGTSCICHRENQNIRNDRYLIRVTLTDLKSVNFEINWVT